MEEKQVNETEIKEDVIIGINEKGEKQTFYKLLEFDSADDGKHYVAYTDYETDETGNYKAYASLVTKENDEIKLEQIENPKVWNFIEMALKCIQDGQGSKNEEEK